MARNWSLTRRSGRSPSRCPGPTASRRLSRRSRRTRSSTSPGLKIEQFHDPALDPEPYWEEALKRDPGDARVNTALGIRELKQARFADAEAHFRKAIERLTAGYASPKDGEPFYYLGLALKAQGRLDDATDAFSKATWSAAWRAAGYYALAEIATQRRDFSAALGSRGPLARVQRPESQGAEPQGRGVAAHLGRLAGARTTGEAHRSPGTRRPGRSARRAVDGGTLAG